LLSATYRTSDYDTSSYFIEITFSDNFNTRSTSAKPGCYRRHQ
jgi:hypothetical protein